MYSLGPAPCAENLPDESSRFASSAGCCNTRGAHAWLGAVVAHYTRSHGGLSPLNLAGVTGAQEGTLMKRHCFTSYPLFALIGLILLPLAVVHASPPFDYEQWRRDHPRPAGKRLADLDVGEPRTVRMIYFLPNDRPYRVAAVDTIKMRMRQAQDWFAMEMGAHGHGNTIVRFEADAAGEPLVHRVDGQHSTEHYNNKYTVDKVLDEIDPVFDFAENVYYIAIDNGNSAIYLGDHLVGGVGSSWSKNGGWGMVPISADFGIVAHELGHAFDLLHDFRDNDYVMSYGYVPDWLLANQRLSACNAEFLAVHTYFNPKSPIEDGSRPTIQENTSSPIHISTGTTSIPVRIKSRDPDGLHQAILLTRTQAPHFAEGSLEVKACRGLEGKRNPVVEFDYDGFAPSRPGSDFNTFETQSLLIQVVDALGNTEWSDLLEIINPEFKKPIATFPFSSYPKYLASMVFSPDGRLLALEASYEDDKVTLRDVSTGKSIANLPSWGPVWTWALSPDGRLLALEAPNGTIVLWDIASEKQHVATAPAHQQDEEFPNNDASSLAFSPNGKLLATGGRGDYLVKLWDVVSGEHVATFPALRYGGAIMSLAFSPDGKRLAAYDAGGTVRLWDVASREHVATIDAHENGSWSGHRGIAFSPDGRLLATGGTRWTSFEVEETSEVKLWNVATGKPISATLFGSAPVAFSPDGRLLATGSGIETKWFDLDGLEGGTRQGENYGGNAVTLWEVSTGEPIAILPPWSRIDDLAFSPGGKRLVEMRSWEVVRLWDLSEWTLIDNDAASEPRAWLTPNPAEIEFSANDPAWKTFIVHTNLDSVLVRANPSGSDPAVEVSGGQQVPTRDYCPAEGNDRPTSGRRDGWNLHVKTCQAGQTKILLIDYDTDTILQQYEVNVEGSAAGKLATTALNPSYPNPFNSETILSYTLPTAADIRLEVFTLSGQRVAILHEGLQAAGYHTIALDASDLASGVYLYRLTTPEGRFVQKFTLLR